jgi:translation initiation factor IF-3
MNTKEKHIINENIRFKEVRVVDDLGDQLGVMNTKKALDMAKSKELDLVVIADKVSPPVVKIVDYSKFKYELSKKAKELAKKNRANRVEIKEISFRPNTDENDLNRLKTRSSEWIEEGHKVKITMVFKGRENHRKQEGRIFLTNFVNEINNSKIEGSIMDTTKGLVVTIHKV